MKGKFLFESKINWKNNKFTIPKKLEFEIDNIMASLRIFRPYYPMPKFFITFVQKNDIELNRQECEKWLNEVNKIKKITWEKSVHNDFLLGNENKLISFKIAESETLGKIFINTFMILRLPIESNLQIQFFEEFDEINTSDKENMIDNAKKKCEEWIKK